MSCAKTAEPIEMQFRMLSQMGPGNMYYMECRCHRGKGYFWGCRADTGQLNSMVKRRILEVWVKFLYKLFFSVIPCIVALFVVLPVTVK